MSTEIPDEEPEGTPDDVPTKTPDGELRLTDDGLEMPAFLRGYVGSFTMRTPSLTGDFETTDSGLPDEPFYDGVIAAYPEDGDYHGDLCETLAAFSTPTHGETVYEIHDERTEDGGGE